MSVLLLTCVIEEFFKKGEILQKSRILHKGFTRNLKNAHYSITQGRFAD